MCSILGQKAFSAFSFIGIVCFVVVAINGIWHVDSAASVGRKEGVTTSELELMLGLEAAEVKSRLGHIFDAIDTDSSGILSDEELHAWMSKTREAVQKKQVALEMDSIDEDNDGKVTLEEMKKAYAENGEEAQEDTINDLRRRLNAVDKDGDGALNAAEVALLMNPGTDETLMNLEVADILKAQDKDQDGKISLAEFMTVDSTEHAMQPEEADQYKTEFANYDINKDGYIDDSEIRKVVASPQMHEVLEGVQEIRGLVTEGELTRAYWLDNSEKFAVSAPTDHGEILRYPNDYNVGLPFNNLPKEEGPTPAAPEEVEEPAPTPVEEEKDEL